MLSLPYTVYDRILLCLFLVFLTFFWAFLSFQIHPKGGRPCPLTTPGPPGWTPCSGRPPSRWPLPSSATAFGGRPSPSSSWGTGSLPSTPPTLPPSSALR